jgi:SAM-dependent methyltransferase
MSSKENLESWQMRWANGQTGWDQGQPHPELAAILSQASLVGNLQLGAKIFSAGCGRAHNEAFIASQGYHVLAIDAIEKAITEARHLYGDRNNLVLKIADAFDVPADELEQYDAVFDRAMLCAIQPHLRSQYIETCYQRLRPGGLFVGLLFREVHKPEGPPFAVDELEAYKLLGDKFHLCYASQASELLQPGAVKAEWISIWRKHEENSHEE